MRAEHLLSIIGDIREDFIHEAAPAAAPRRRSWRQAVGLAACLALALLAVRFRPFPAYGQPAGNNTPAENGLPADSELPPFAGTGDPGGSEAGCCPPSLTVEGVTYVVSGRDISVECPEGFTYAGETTVTYHDGFLPYYTNPERPEWVYVYQECYNQQTQEPYMAYVRYVEEVLGGLTLVRYQGELYVYLNDTYYLPYRTEISPEDQARYDAVPYDIILKELPAGFAPVGKTVLDEYDLAPVSELGCNRMSGHQVLANPEQPDILLLRHYWSGLKGPDYWVFVRYSHRS